MHLQSIVACLFISGVFSQQPVYVPPKVYDTGDQDITQPGPCPAYLPPVPDFEFPHLAIPISKKNLNKAYRNTLTPSVTAGDMEMIFNFDIPEYRKGYSCVFEFYLPYQSELSTSSYELIGDYGEYAFSLSARNTYAVEGQTTYANNLLQGNPHGWPGVFHAQPGHAWAIGASGCDPGRIAITMSSTNGSLKWFQDTNTCALGLFIIYQKPPS